MWNLQLLLYWGVSSLDMCVFYNIQDLLHLE